MVDDRVSPRRRLSSDDTVIRDSLPTGTVASLLTVAVLLSALSAPVAATQHADDRAFVVDLAEDGSATVTVHFAYDLGSDAEREAFGDLQANDTLQERTKTEFLNRMQAVAASAAERTDRSMSVSDARIAFETRDDGATGVVSLSVEWSGLAAQRDGSLVVSAPFDGEYEPNRTFVVRGPDGSTLADATPEPSDASTNEARWEAGVSLDGFSVAFAPADTTTTAAGTDSTSQSGPGFGALAVFLALSAFVALLTRRRR